MIRSNFIRICLLLCLIMLISGCEALQPSSEPIITPVPEPEVEQGSTTELEPTIPPTEPTETEGEAFDELILGMKVIDSGLVNSFARNGDILAVWVKEDLTWSERLLTTIPVENRMLMTASLEGLEETLDALEVEITYLGYDLERWERTPLSEQENPVEAVKLAQQIAHTHGLTLVLGPSKYFNEKFGAELAPHTDIYVPQVKGYQARLSTEEYHKTVGALLTSLKEANPELILFLDLSPTPKGFEKSPEEMIESLRGVRHLVDGLWITSTRKHADQVEEFIELVRP